MATLRKSKTDIRPYTDTDNLRIEGNEQIIGDDYLHTLNTTQVDDNENNGNEFFGD